MNNLLNQITSSPSSLASNQVTFRSLSIVNKVLLMFTWIMSILAFVAAIVLITSDIFSPLLPHAPISAAPLLLIGAASLAFQILTQPKPLDLFKALIVSVAFMLWGVDQLLPPGWFATTLGDVVISLYVIDLGWMMIDRLKQRNNMKKAK